MGMRLLSYLVIETGKMLRSVSKIHIKLVLYYAIFMECVY